MQSDRFGRELVPNGNRPANPINRRAFLAGAAGTVATPALLRAADGGQQRAQKNRSRPARNVIFMVADGMSAGTLTLADLFIRERLGRPSHWIDWIERSKGHSDGPVRTALMNTAPAIGHVTDSAAAASAWAIGELVRNGAISHTVDGRSPDPFGVTAKRAGKAVGLVSTTRLTDATPAAWMANNESRRNEDAIGRHLINRGTDVLLGGGARHLPNELLETVAGAPVVRTRADLKRIATERTPSRLIGLFADSSMHYEIDRADDEPTLAEMTTAALRCLDQHDDGFFAVIEGARVDHAAHANDPVALVYDQWAFDQAVKVAIDYCDPRDDTLLVVTTDHANANPGLATYMERGGAQLSRLQNAKHSYEWIFDRWDDLSRPERTGEAMARLIQQATGAEIEADEMDTLMRWQRGEQVDPYDFANRNGAPLGAVLANHLGVAFNSVNHTSDHVLVNAQGPGAELLPPVLAINEVHRFLAGALEFSEISSRR